MFAAIVFDGDDTLWITEPLYDHARACAREVVQKSGLDGALWEAFERRYDIDNVGRFGFSAERFPTSCVEAYDTVCDLARQPADSATRELIRAIARRPFESQAPAADDADATLRTLRTRDIRLGLLTKGDREVQTRRIETSGLAGHFEVIEIVTEKEPHDFQTMIARLDAMPSQSLSVGNSVRSDLIPALAAGLQAVWLDAPVWEHEQAGRTEDPRVRKIDRLRDLVDLAT